MANKSKQKGNRFEYECVKVLKEMGYKDVERAFASNGLDARKMLIYLQMELRSNVK
jgi:Holliday junction resolvase